MNVRYYVVLLLIVFAVGFYPKESFAPIIQNSNNTINANETTQSYTFVSPDFIIIVIGIAIGVSLIIFVLSRLNRQLDSESG
jgi:uncharacterized membrane protein YgaE (UPF0421/DUF939 family)